MAWSCGRCRPAGDFQWPKVLWAASGRNPGISIGKWLSESCNVTDGGVKSRGRGEPSGLKLNWSTWNEHFVSSNFPPEMKSKSFHVCASCVNLVRSTSNSTWCCGCQSFSAALVSSTKPLSFNWTFISPDGSVNVAPWAKRSKSVAEMKSHSAGELPEPCPDPYKGNCVECEYSVSEMPIAVQSLYLAS